MWPGLTRAVRAISLQSARCIVSNPDTDVSWRNTHQRRKQPPMSTDTPHRTAAEHLARAESLLHELERALAGHNGTDLDLAATIAQLHVGIARCMAEIQVAEKHVELADMLTAYSIDARDIEDKDHGPDSWPPIQT